MNSLTHAFGGLALTTATCIFAPSFLGPISPAVLTAGLIGSILPDIDHPKAKISNSTLLAKMVSKTVSVTTGHRGPCHSLLFVALISFLLYRFAVPYVPFLTVECVKWLAVGMLSHLLLDMLNPMGINLFWPITKRKRHLLRIKTGSTGEKVIAIMLFIADAILLGLLFIPNTIPNI